MKRMVVFAFSLLCLGSGGMLKAQDVYVGVRVEAPVRGAVLPSWLGVKAWDAPYVYIPELDLYYSVGEGFYYYLDNGQWCCCMSLPVAFQAYDLSSLRHVAIHTPMPWRYNRQHRARYCRAGQMKPLRKRTPEGKAASLPHAPNEVRAKDDDGHGVAIRRDWEPEVGNKNITGKINTEGKEASARRFVKKGLRRVSSDVDAVCGSTASPSVLN